MDEEGKIIIELEVILELKVINLHRSKITEYKIKWRGLLAEETTWKFEAYLVEHPCLLML